MSVPLIVWPDLILMLPLCGSLWVWSSRDPDEARRHALIMCGSTLFCAIAAWLQFVMSDGAVSVEQLSILSRLFGVEFFGIDALNAPLLPLVSLLYLLIVLGTLGAKVAHVSFGRMLLSEAILLATLTCVHSQGIIVLLAVGTVPPWIELRTLHKPTRIYLCHTALFWVLLVTSQALTTFGIVSQTSMLPIVFLTVAILLRSGIVPMHCWFTDLFEHASLGTAMLFAMPMVGAYAAVRLVLPTAPDWLLQGFAVLSLATAVYAAGMALVQREARRLFCYLFLSNSSLVFVGLETATPLSLTGALCAWLSVALSLTGFGLTLRSVESRIGRISLDTFHGLYEHMPSLAVLFLITGLASIGFPGTAGFVGTELLVEGAVRVSPLIGIAIVTTAALNGLAVLHGYFRVFTGTRRNVSIELRGRPAEQIAVLILVTLILGGGLFPQPGVVSRYDFAVQTAKARRAHLAGNTAATPATLRLSRIASATSH